MEEQTTLYAWLAEYCCKMKYHDGLKTLISSKDGSIAINNVNNVRLSLSVVHSIVVNTFDIVRFSTAVSIVNDLFDGLPAELMQYKLFAKVTTGLKILSLFSMLQCGDKMVLPKLNEYFPRTGIQHHKADKKLAEKLSIAQLRFRKFLLSLIANKDEQTKYFQNGYKVEYGQEFQSKVKILVSQFIGIIEDALPPTHIEKLTSVKSGSPLAIELAKLTSPALNLMLDILYEKKKISEKEVKDLVGKTAAERVTSQDTTAVQNKSNHHASPAVSREPNCINRRKRKSSESQKSNENDKKQSNGVTEQTQLSEQNKIDSKKVGYEQDLQLHHCITEVTAPESVYEKISQVKAKVPLGKIYKMSFRSSKANKSFKAGHSLSEKSNKCDKLNIKSRSPGYIPEQVQTVSSSSEADCGSQEKHLSHGSRTGNDATNVTPEMISEAAPNIDIKNRYKEISPSIDIHKLNNLSCRNDSATVLSVKPSIPKPESPKSNIHIHKLNSLQSQKSQECIESQGRNSISRTPSLKLKFSESSALCARKTLPTIINADDTSNGADEFISAKSNPSSQECQSVYHSCLNTPEREVCMITNNTEEENLSQNFLKMSQENSGRSSSASVVLDSNEHSPSSSPAILASSYSLDQFDALLQRNDAEKLPELGRHLKDTQTRLCIIKLHRHKEHHIDNEGCFHNIYS